MPQHTPVTDEEILQWKPMVRKMYHRIGGVSNPLWEEDVKAAGFAAIWEALLHCRKTDRPVGPAIMSTVIARRMIDERRKLTLRFRNKHWTTNEHGERVLSEEGELAFTMHNYHSLDWRWKLDAFEKDSGTGREQIIDRYVSTPSAEDQLIEELENEGEMLRDMIEAWAARQAHGNYRKERNAEVLRRTLNGERTGTLGPAMGITQSRVSQIKMAFIQWAQEQVREEHATA